ncbi:MAG: hypothetical protein V7727_02660 [Sneathiella sp.]
MTKHILTIIAFIIVTFTVQGLSHFVINKAHFDAISFARAEPIMALGFLVMLIEGAVISGALSSWMGPNVTIKNSLIVSYAFGLFLGSYIAFTEPAKYEVVSIGSWVAVEGLASLIQFGVFGILMGLIHKNSYRSKGK